MVGGTMLCLDGLGADGHFHRAGRAEHVAGRALGGADGEFSRVIAENGLDGLGFADVALRRGGAVGVDVGNVGGIQAARCARPFSCSAPRLRPRATGAVM